MRTFDALFSFGTARPTDWDFYALSLLAQISYDGNATRLRQWANALGVPIAERYVTPSSATPNVCFVGTDRRIIVAVSGTENFDQMWGNITYSAQRAAGDFGAGHVHSFFLWCAEQIVDFFRTHLEAMTDLEEIVLVGHSLGGAVAQLLADWLANNSLVQVRLCVTFNSPRVGNTTWATMTRPYKTWLLFNARDWVCELPLAVHVGLETDTIGVIRAERYAHRETLVSIQSALPFTPAGGFNFGAGFWFDALEGKNVISNTVFGFGALGTDLNWIEEGGAPLFLSMYMLSGALAIGEHQIDRISRALEEEALTQVRGEDVELVSLGNLMLQGAFVQPAGPTSLRFIAPARHFLTAAPPPVPLPSPTLQAFIECEDAEITWAVTPGLPVGPAIADSNWRIFADALATATNPAIAALPASRAVFDVPDLPHWLFRGNDRRLLTKLWELVGAIDARDYLAAVGDSTAALSTREPIIDEDTQEAWLAMKSQLAHMLSLYYE